MQNELEHQHGTNFFLANIREFKNKPVVIVFGFFVVLGQHASE